MRENHESIDPCEFCKILHKPTLAKTQILYQDDQFFAFYDIEKATAKEHILVCTKQHIETAMDVPDFRVLIEMEKRGKKVLDFICEKEGWHPSYRFGFHLKPYNSIDHIHLHCFVLPFASLVKDKMVYGKMLTSIEEVIVKLRERNFKQSAGRL